MLKIHKEKISLFEDNLINSCYEKETQINKRIFRKDGIVCSVFDTGTILIQGDNNTKEIEYIKYLVNYINGELYG